MTDKKNSTKKETMDAAALVEQTTIADIYRAAFYLDNVAIKTKLIESPFFSSICENTVLLKPENLQVTGSFKLRGAYNKISQLSHIICQQAHFPNIHTLYILPDVLSHQPDKLRFVLVYYPEVQSAFFGQFFTHSMHRIHSVPFLRFLELSVTSTFIGHTRLHFPQDIHFSLSHFIRIIEK